MSLTSRACIAGSWPTEAAVRLPWRRATLEKAAWLSDDTLLTIGWCLAPPRELTAHIVAAGESRPADARWIAYPRPDVGAPYGAGGVTLIRFPSPLDRQDEHAGLGLELKLLERFPLSPGAPLHDRLRCHLFAFLQGHLDDRVQLCHGEVPGLVAASYCG